MRKTNVRQHKRHLESKDAEVRNHTRSVRDRPVLGRIPLKRLNYPQAKRRMPFIEPTGDIDDDGVVNKKDCRPFDEERQDELDTQQKRLRKTIREIQEENDEYEMSLLPMYEEQLEETNRQILERDLEYGQRTAPNILSSNSSNDDTEYLLPSPVRYKGAWL